MMRMTTRIVSCFNVVSFTGLFATHMAQGNILQGVLFGFLATVFLVIATEPNRQ